MVRLRQRLHRLLKHHSAIGLMCIALYLALCQFNPVCAAVSDDDARKVAQIAARLAAPPGVRAEFVQTQFLAATQKPLVSTGSLVFLRDRGLVWRIATPYQTLYRITADGVSEIDARGVRKPTANPNGMRSMGQISQMLNAMLGGDLSALYSQFDVIPSGSLAQWQMLLTPNQPQLAQAITKLTLHGGEYLQGIVILLASGDSIDIEFLHSASVGILTPTERSQLGVS